MSFPPFMTTRRFWPLFVTQFLGAVNDNLFKSALTVLIIYRLAASGQEGQIFASVGTGLFILPYAIFSALAGQLADKYEKARLFRIVKACEIVIMAAGVAALFAGHVGALLAILFLMGTQSTFFSPLKYAVLPDHLAEEELLAGNAVLETGTFIAILGGTLIGTQAILISQGVEIVSGLLLAIAVLGFVSSFFIPAAAPPSPDLKIALNPVSETLKLVKDAASHYPVGLLILGISWFWLVGAVTLSLLPSLAKDLMNANEGVLSLFLALFSIGVGAGSLLCSKILKGEVSARIAPFGALGMAVAGGDLCVAIFFHVPPAFFLQETQIDVSAFLLEPFGWRIMADLFFIAAFGGFYVVPLNAMMQARSEPEKRARTIAANNIVNAVFMAGGAMIAAVMLAAGLGLSSVFLALAVGNLLCAVIICQLLPESTLKLLLSAVIARLYRVRLSGWDNLAFAPPEAGRPGRVIIANHLSFLDAAFLVLFIPGKVTFAINTQMAEKWWVRPFLRLVDALPVDPANPLSIKALVRLTQSGKDCVIFPEGRLTQTGGLMKIYDGSAMVADRADADIVMVRIDGLEYTPFTRLNGRLPVRWFPKVALTAFPPQKIAIDPTLSGKKRRQEASRALYSIMSNAIFASEDTGQTLWTALIKAANLYGWKKEILEDVMRKPLRYADIVRGSIALGRVIASITKEKETVGVLLPSSNGFAVSFMALQAMGRLPAILNFSTGAANMVQACKTAALQTVLTSRLFVEKAGLEQTILALEQNAGVTIVYLEDLRAKIGLGAKISALFARRSAATLPQPDPDSPAVILFTSGSEGAPKGVVLSHRNIIANCRQIHAHIDFTTADSAFNPLPVFHSLGLTGGLLLMLFYGVRTFLYPSPLHYKIVSELVYDWAPTVLFSTDTFLSGYARTANPYDFRSLRFIIAGAEKVRDETRRTWADQFGVKILEGYGATEASPVLALNNNLYFRAGTVGPLLPGVSARLDPVPGIENGGRLFVKGQNLLIGYMKADQPGVVQPATEDGWYDTGDVAQISADGFLSLSGRLKRFAKIGGEMVSLPAIEEEMRALWPDGKHAVIAMPDPKKGEQLVALTTENSASRALMAENARLRHLPELGVPKIVKQVDAIPLLGNGKTDYQACIRLAEGLLG